MISRDEPVRALGVGKNPAGVEFSKLVQNNLSSEAGLLELVESWMTEWLLNHPIVLVFSKTRRPSPYRTHVLLPLLWSFAVLVIPVAVVRSVVDTSAFAMALVSMKGSDSQLGGFDDSFFICVCFRVCGSSDEILFGKGD